MNCRNLRLCCSGILKTFHNFVLYWSSFMGYCILTLYIFYCYCCFCTNVTLNSLISIHSLAVLASQKKSGMTNNIKSYAQVKNPLIYCLKLKKITCGSHDEGTTLAGLDFSWRRRSRVSVSPSCVLVSSDPLDFSGLGETLPTLGVKLCVYYESVDYSLLCHTE